jgi:hypothetical protein
VAERLLRVTAVAGGRRSDLAVPGEVAVAELVPDLARAVGLLDPAAVYAGYRLHAHGHALRPDRGLREQGVDDGALLAVEVDDSTPPLSCDDVAEAAADAVQRRRPWQPADTRRTTLVAGVAALLVGLTALAFDFVLRVTSGWDVAEAAGAAAVVAPVLLALVVLAGNALPTVAVAVGVGRAEGVPVDPDQVGSLVSRSGRTLLVGSAGVGLVALLTVPLVAGSVSGGALAAGCCVVLLLRARRHRWFAQVLADAAGGLVGLLAVAVTLAVRDPDTRPWLVGAMMIGGVVAGAVSRLPAPPQVLRARALDLLETLVLVALAPLLLLAADGLITLTGA